MSNVDTASPPKNDTRLMQRVRLRVLRPFCVQGQPLATGTIVALPRYVATDMIALGKAEIVDERDT